MRRTPDDDGLAAPVVFTIVARNYLAYARVLMRSVAIHHPQSLRIVILCDEHSGAADHALLADVLPVGAIGIPDLAAMAFGYSVMEFCTAVKPYTFLHLADRHPGRALVYLDPDILVTAPLQHVLDALADGAELVLTPHIGAPLQDGAYPDDLAIMKSGVYNLGFAAMLPGEQGFRLLRWWAQRCRRDAVVDLPNHRFTDQRWMDLAPSFVRRTHLLHEAGYNLAYWNLPHRTVSEHGGQLHVNGEPLRFAHFSGAGPDDRQAFSRHQNRFTADNLAALRPLYDAYLAALVAEGWAEDRKAPYAYGAFAGGRPVHQVMRGAFRRDEAKFGSDPFAGDGEAFDTPEPGFGDPGVTRLMAELWRRRTDLQRAFDLDLPQGRHAFIDWFVQAGAAEAGLDGASVRAAAALRVAPVSDRAPWRSLPAALFDGPSGGVGPWLSEPVPLQVLTDCVGVVVPRQLALAWEARDDLRRAFPNQSQAELENFLVWGLTSGVREGALDLNLAGARLAPFLDFVEVPGDGASPPATRLARLLARCCDHPLYRPMLGDAGLGGRIGASLWTLRLAGLHPEWPVGFTAALRTWCEAGPDEDDDMASPPILEAVWRVRPDLRRRIGRVDEVDRRARLIAWALLGGFSEMGLPAWSLPQRFRTRLGEPCRPGEAHWRKVHALVSASCLDVQGGLRPGSQEAASALDTKIDPTLRAGWAMEPPAAHHRPAPAPRRSPIGAQTAPILLTGLCKDVSGRGEDVRTTAAALTAARMHPILLERTSGCFETAGYDGARTGVRRFRANIVHLNADTAVADHLFLRRALRNRPWPFTIGFWAWELPELPAAWRAAYAVCDEVWASTEFTAQAFRRGSTRPVHVMSMAVDPPAAPANLTRAALGLPSDRFLFHLGFDFRSHVRRKNPHAGIAAFRRAFPSGAESVALIVKTLGGAQHAGDLAALRTSAAGDERIIIRDGALDADEHAALAGLCDAYLSLHRSEGFGRGLAEAMALGKPVVATGWSGNMDYMDETTAFPVAYRMQPLAPGDYPGWEGQSWAEPDVDHAAALLREVATRPDLACRVGQAARRHMREHHSPEVIGRRYRCRLNKIAAEAGERALEE